MKSAILPGNYNHCRLNIAIMFADSPIIRHGFLFNLGLTQVKPQLYLIILNNFSFEV